MAQQEIIEVKKWYVAELFWISRPHNCLLYGFGVYLGANFAGMQEVTASLVLAMLAAMLNTAAGATVNDANDARIDEICHPERPIPSGRLPSSFGRRFGYSEHVLAILCGFLAHIYCGLLVLGQTGLLFLYERYLKRTPWLGNMSIAVLVGSVVLMGAVTSGSISVALIPAAVIMTFTWGREIFKDIEDSLGDFDRLTLPKTVGVGNARLTAALFLFGTGFSMIFYGALHQLHGVYYLACLVVFLLIGNAFVSEANRFGKGSEYLKLALTTTFAALYISILPP